MTSRRLPFIDWMKCLGMILIVLGHTGAQNLFHPSQPINFKQFGVAFFVFVMGFSLAREKRDVRTVLWNRLFEIYLFGGAFALVVSAVSWFVRHDVNESNYLPLALGANVLFNHFPANPTTWYIGTYLHLLLAWAIVWRRVNVRLWMVAGCCLLEVVVRAVLMQRAGDFVAYMLFTNWTSLLLLGLYVGRRSQETESEERSFIDLPLSIGLMAGLLIVWPRIVGAIGFVEGLPFGRLNHSNRVYALVATSAAVSFLYFAYTWSTFRITRVLPRLRIVEFFADNTLIVFIVHMPMIYVLTPYLYPLTPSAPVRLLVNLLVFFVLPACASGVIRYLIPPTALRDKVASLARAGLHRRSNPSDRSAAIARQIATEPRVDEGV